MRDHGTGYFAFSQDHEKRQEQMEELNSLRQEVSCHKSIFLALIFLYFEVEYLYFKLLHL